MLPIATPPNAIIFGSGEIEMREMVRAGVILNFVGILLIALIFYFYSAAMLGFDLTSLPDWAIAAR
jgi:sodium-dependent dicarboxylate transporter 2/3/5